ncbi:hypothetical protein XELAEV_18019074mg [Xenopus laevis]|uniref:Uncharacterized protein n=1 Tax=Xenopus laevis TaxID=8355 RepID=A0A974DEA4_XENLA|nr:hypothetical protein XELAEV_18019074mg [Xenopus laevis]
MEPLGERNPVLQSFHSNIQRDTDTIQGEGTQVQYRKNGIQEKGIMPCRAYTLIYKWTKIQYREKEPLGKGNPSLQSLHSNIQWNTYTMQGEGTIRKRESCPAELTL